MQKPKRFFVSLNIFWNLLKKFLKKALNPWNLSSRVIKKIYNRNFNVVNRSSLEIMEKN